jgi:hypothetical protein
MRAYREKLKEHPLEANPLDAVLASAISKGMLNLDSFFSTDEWARIEKIKGIKETQA